MSIVALAVSNFLFCWKEKDTEGRQSGSTFVFVFVSGSLFVFLYGHGYVGCIFTLPVCVCVGCLCVGK